MIDDATREFQRDVKTWTKAKRQSWLEAVGSIADAGALEDLGPMALRVASAACVQLTADSLASVAFNGHHLDIDDRRIAAVAWAYLTGFPASRLDPNVADDCADDRPTLASADAVGTLLFGASGLLLGGEAIHSSVRDPDPIKAGQQWRGRLSAKTNLSDFARCVMKLLPKGRGKPRAQSKLSAM